ncbi:MAG: tRNA (adenosine(37)-N6)-dimethylallyltransferase MiaA [Isosphaera sp.]|nr:tRNA (adenosine(37)-N6)-dimethylallyltransferase MiaA [Isosphaera sp.]
MSAFENALILTGPTASGKTALALDLADRVGAEVVALDSMTVYRGMDVGTAKPTPDERARVRHHLVDILDPWESLTVADWLDRAAAACRDITARGRRPLFVGGTPFYLKALLHGLFPGPPADPDLRRDLEAEAERAGNAALHARLAAVDPKTAARLHPNDVRRVVRALEVHALTGRPISDWQQTWDTAAFADPARPAPPPAAIPAVVLELPREELYDRVNRRVDAMLAAGWLDEVRRLRDLPRPLSREARQALGYGELLAYLDRRDGRQVGWAEPGSAGESHHRRRLPGPGPVGWAEAGASPGESHRAARGGTRPEAGLGPPYPRPAGPDWDETADLIRTRTRQFAKRQLTWFRHLPQLVRVPVGVPGVVGRVLAGWGLVNGPAGN